MDSRVSRLDDKFRVQGANDGLAIGIDWHREPFAFDVKTDYRHGNEHIGDDFELSHRGTGCTHEQ
jgi:hypothetical protein